MNEREDITIKNPPFGRCIISLKMLKAVRLHTSLATLVLFFALIPLTTSHSADLANGIDEEKVAEVKNIQNLIPQSRVSFLSTANLHLRISPEIQSLVKAAELNRTSINLIVKLRDEFCETEIQKRAGWTRKEKTFLMSELRKEVQKDVLQRMQQDKPKMMHHFDPFNSMEISVSSETELLNLVRDPRVKSVEQITLMKPALNQSLPLIQHPVVQAAGHGGAGVAVAVIDTAIDYTLPHFGSCTVPANTSNPDCSVVADIDFSNAEGGSNDGPGPDSLNDHGTRTAGIVRAIATDADIIGLDVFPNIIEPTTPSSAVIQALQWVALNADDFNIVAVNLSLGGIFLFAGACDNSGTGYSANDFATLRDLGVVPVVSSGNDGAKALMNSPACVSNTVSVGAVSDVTGVIDGVNNYVFDSVDWYSNSSATLDLLAPGSWIGMAGVVDDAAGTSFAAPHVAGAVALSRASDGFPADTVQQTIDRLKNTGDLVTDPANGRQTPRINLGRLFDLIASPEILSPLTGDTLASGSVTVNWDAMGTVPTLWAVRAGTGGPGSQDLAAPASLGSGATSDILTGLPTDGSSFTISLYALQNGVWNVVDSEQVTAFTAPAPAQPEITSPLTGDTLGSGSVTVNWDAMGTVPTLWAVRAGTGGPGSQDLAAPASLGSGATSDILTGLPTDGSSFTISLYALQNGVWNVVDSEQVTAFTAPAPAQPEITSPLTGDTLGSGSVTVNWDAMGTVPTLWAVRAGTGGPGSQDLAAPASLGSGATSDILTGLPTDGSSFTISLYALQNGVWNVVDSEQVTAFTAPAPAQPEITSPLTGDTLGSGSVTVNWDAMGTVPTLWAVRAGTGGPGSQDLAAPASLGSGATSDILTGLPTDGSSFTISLYALQNGVWNVVDSEQVTAFTAPAPAQPEITSPLTGDTLGSGSVTVNWDAMGTVPTLWAVRAGTGGPGSQDLAAPASLGSGATSDILTGLPTDGSSFTISLYALQNGVWNVVDSEQVTAFTAPAPAQPEITSPLTGDTLGSGSVTVNWDAMGTVPTLWAVRAGTGGPGSQDLGGPPSVGPAVSSSTLTGLPTDGSSFTISLYALQNGVWNVVDSLSITAPNFISGTFSIAGSFTETGCQDPTDDGVSNITGTFITDAQVNSVFSGSLTVATLDGVSLAANGAAINGTFPGTHTQTAANGNYTLNGLLQNVLVSQNQGTFDATLAGNTITVNMSGSDIIGDTCALTGTFSGDR